MDKMTVIAGLDIGNGYVKGSTRCMGDKPTTIDLPSCVAYLANESGFPTPKDKLGADIANIFNCMDLDFDTPLIKDNGRRLFGKRGLTSGKSIENFNIDSHKSKAEQDLSAVLTLGCIAGTALQDYWNANHVLPSEILKVHARVALALPIDEYKKHREMFAYKFKSTSHVVSFHNFEQPVRMEIVFDDVQVLAEGASAQFAIISKGEPLMNLMLADVRSHGVKLEGITSQDILAAEGTVGIDIGEGTVNFPVFINGEFNTDASSTLSKGWGTVLTDSIEPLTSRYIPFNNRKALAEFLQQKPSTLTQSKRDAVMNVVNGEAQNLVREIVAQFIRVMERSNGLIQVAYVYGGGASPVKELLYDALIEAAREFCGGGEFPILYLDSQYSRYLNKEGLYSIAEQFAKTAK